MSGAKVQLNNRKKPMAIDFVRNIISSGYNLAKINDNFEKIEAALENAVARDGTSPNHMLQDLDLNNYNLLNVNNIDATTLTINGQVVSTEEVALDILNDVIAAKDAAEDAADLAVATKNEVEDLVDGLAFEVFDTQSDAQNANIVDSANYIAVAGYVPQPRFYKRFPTNPGSGDRFQSLDGDWWQGLPLPGTTIDYVNAVQRASNASLVSGDMDKAHRWTIPVSTTYTVTLPDPALNIGRVVDIGVNDSSQGLLAVAYTTNPIGKFSAGGLFMWAGESMTLIARSTEWEIIGGRCIPCTLYATAPGSDIGMTSGVTLNLNGWQTTFTSGIHTGARFAINGSSQIVIPRQGFYNMRLDVAYAWSVAPTSLYASANGNAILDRYFSGLYPINDVLHPCKSGTFAAGTVLTPQTLVTGGTSVGVRSTTYGPPQFTLIEAPQW